MERGAEREAERGAEKEVCPCRFTIWMGPGMQRMQRMVQRMVYGTVYGTVYGIVTLGVR